MANDNNVFEDDEVEEPKNYLENDEGKYEEGDD